MKLSDWVYIGEGGKHVVFAYQGSNASEYKSKAWRVPKELIVHEDQKIWKESLPRSTLQAVITQWIFGSFVDIPEILTLDYVFVRTLCSEAVKKGKIPNSRLKDWNIESVSDGLEKRLQSNFPTSISGMLLPNYQDKSFAFSVELKPKAGYLPSSALVHPERRFKYHLSRFQILQKLNYDGVLEKGWNKGNRLEQMSQYDPLDLFSGETQRISRAIRALFICPQNNLKVYSAGNLIYGHDVVDLGGFQRGFEMMGARDFKTEDMVTELQSILVKALYESSFLYSLGSFQKKFDILDVDGAILIYEHLLFLCDGEADKADNLIDVEYQDVIDKVQNGDLDQSGFLGMNSSQLHHAIGTCSKEYNTFVEELCRNFDHQLLNETYMSACTLVKSLNSCDCARLLGNWLISQALVDLSFFVCIQKSPSKGTCYKIKVVDYDCKPSRKLRYKAQFERKLHLSKSNELVNTDGLKV